MLLVADLRESAAPNALLATAGGALWRLGPEGSPARHGAHQPLGG
jgi:hypothetical protein